MEPCEFIKFCNENRKEFFKKYPQPSKNGPRALWRQSLNHAHNALDDRDYDPKTFDKFKKNIENYLKN